MTDPRALADDATQHLDRLSAVILDDVGDGPPPGELAASARAARDAVAKVGVPAFTQLTGLVAGVADSMVAGATEWSPSLGGTLMAAVDDLRHLVGRAAQFSDEDNEHLHHRAAELSVYVRVNREEEPRIQDSATEVGEVAAPVGSAPPTAAAPTITPQPAPSTAAAPGAPIVPIAELFYADQGPHVLRGGVPTTAEAKSDLLGRGIEALESFLAQPMATPIAVGATAVVPVETLVYRGRAALERAAALREQIRSSGTMASPATLDEMYDLIGLALKD